MHGSAEITPENAAHVDVNSDEGVADVYKLLDDLGLTYAEKGAILKYKGVDSYFINAFYEVDFL